MGGWQEPHSLPGREQREESPTRPPAPTPWALGERGAGVLGPGVEGGVALGEDPGRSGVRAGVQALSAPWLGGSPRISTGLLPPAPHVRKVPRRDQVEASGRRNTRSYWAPWGGPQDADLAEGRPGAQAPGEAVARSPACGHRTVQTPFCRRLHKWGELERSRGQVPCFLRAASAPRTQTGVTEERSLRM